MSNFKNAQGARKHSQDPKQEALRAHKDTWNKACSEFIARINKFKPELISFKRGLNGRGDPNAGIPASNIKDPLPNEIKSSLSDIAREFQSLATTFDQIISSADSIIQEQSNYSQTRRKPKISNSQFSYQEILMVEASNPLSRLWASFKSFFSSKEGKAYRISMLKLSQKIYYDLISLEEELLKKNVDNIETIVRKHMVLSNNISILEKNLIYLMDQVGETGSELPNESETQDIDSNAPNSEKGSNNTDVEDSIKNIVNNDLNSDKTPSSDLPPVSRISVNPINPNKPSEEDVNKMRQIVSNFMKSKVGFNYANARAFFALIQSYKAEPDPIKKESLAADIYRNFQKINKKFIELANKEANINALLTKEANPISRFINKVKHQYGFTDEYSADRLSMYEKAHSLRKIINKVMDILEKSDVDFIPLKNYMTEAKDIVESMKDPLRTLKALHNRKLYESKEKIKGHVDPTLQYLNMDLRRELRKNLNKEYAKEKDFDLLLRNHSKQKK